jgi:hypothetical protein
MDNGKSFMGKITLVAALLVLADLGIGGWLSRCYHRITHGEQGRLNYIADSVTTPVLILGSSRAVHHYVPTIVADSLHLDCYNAGKDQQGLYYDLAVLKMALRRYHPREVILDLTPTDFGDRTSALDVLAVLLPYYHSHPEIQPILDWRSPWEGIKTSSTLYCYNSLVFQTIGNTLAKEETDSVYRGYLPKFDTLGPNSDPFYTNAELEALPDSAMVAVFNDILTLAKQNGCRLAVVVSPVYFPLTRGSSTIRLARKICARQAIPFFDYTQSPSFTPGRSALFYDNEHCNDSGARQFTRMLCSDLIAKESIFGPPHEQ